MKCFIVCGAEFLGCLYMADSYYSEKRTEKCVMKTSGLGDATPVMW